MLKRKKKEMGGVEKLRAKKKMVKTGCSLMLHIDRAFSGGGQHGYSQPGQ